MIRARPLCSQEACLVAVSALDDLVRELVQACHLTLPSAFFDWVADEATPLVEQQMADFFDHPQFAATLRIGDHRLALSRWVRLWVGPRITARFASLIPHVPAADPRLPTLVPLSAVTAAPVAPRPIHARPRSLPGLAVLA